MNSIFDFISAISLVLMVAIAALVLGAFAGLILMTIEHPTKVLDRLFEHRTIVNCEREPYLYRWYVFRTKRVSLFIHKFVRSDEDRALHDHPWAFLVIPIWRGYIEHSDILTGFDFEAYSPDLLWNSSEERASAAEVRKLVARRIWPIISTRYRPALYRHRVELIDGKPSWSLFFHFTKEREWGFHPAEGFIQWNKWWSEKCE